MTNVFLKLGLNAARTYLSKYGGRHLTGMPRFERAMLAKRFETTTPNLRKMAEERLSLDNLQKSFRRSWGQGAYENIPKSNIAYDFMRNISRDNRLNDLNKMRKIKLKDW
jgi:hypothetical protein